MSMQCRHVNVHAHVNCVYIYVIYVNVCVSLCVHMCVGMRGYVSDGKGAGLHVVFSMHIPPTESHSVSWYMAGKRCKRCKIAIKQASLGA